jgi:two-component system cell cycle sensor histidine kinase PleC
MFNSLRSFAFISLGIILPIVIGLGVYFRIVVENDIIVKMAETQNFSVSHGFSRSVWKRYAPSLKLLPCRKEPCPDTAKFYEALQKDVEDYFQPLTLLQYNIYHATGEKIVTNEQFTADASLDRESEKAFLAAQYGHVKSVLLFGYRYGNGEFNVVRTFVPLRSGTGGSDEVEGIIELFYDITPMWKNPLFYQILSISLICAMVAFLFAMVFFVSRRAESIITKQHEMTMDLSSAKASAEAENREKSKFLANVSHELRTPLNAIIGFSEILKDEVMGPLGNEQYKEYVRDIHSSGVHLLSLINDILDFSKANAGKLEIELSDVDVNKLLKSSMRLVLPRAQEAEVTLNEDLPSDHAVLKTDPKRLKQCVLNLLSNSVKFTPSGGTITLRAWDSVSDQRFVIEVVDTGVGIAAKDISKVMATFGQAENKLSRRYEGTGLGLPLSKKLVELMGGTFEIQSEEGKGTTVIISLPKHA